MNPIDATQHCCPPALTPGRPNLGIRSLRLRDRRFRARGQGLTEFALVLPVMILMLLIAIDFGRLFFSYIEINNAAREGANYAGANFWSATPPDLSSITAVAAQETNAQNQVGESTLKVAFVCFAPTSPTVPISDCHANGPGGSGIGNQVAVTVTESFTFLTPLISNFFGALDISTTSTAALLNVVQP